MTQQETLQHYFQALVSEYDALQGAIETNFARQSQGALKLQKEIAAAQRETIEFSQKLAEDINNPAAVYTDLTSAALTAQAHTLNFARLAYEQAAQAGADATKQLDQITKAAQQLNEATIELTRSWGQAVPFADAWQQTVQAFASAAQPVER